MSSAIAQGMPEAIAIVGVSCRFPGARSIDEFWRNLAAGRESVSFFSDRELLAAGVAPALLSDPHYVKASAVIEDIEMFDAHFFGFTPREAEITDPQQRLFLEAAWEALENAGYNPETFGGVVGVYAGCSESRYVANLYSNPDYARRLDNFRVMIGNGRDYLPTMVSYKLNLTGPSISVQTACSTSLVAAHLACQSLLDYQCDMALAGGVTVGVPQATGYLYQEGGITSPDGHCRAFDAGARGTVGGNGLGIVVLKRLSEAVASGDHIHAVIKGSAINNDGAAKVGFTAPGVLGQAGVISMAQALAEVDPQTVGYVEAHGSGTEMGDPIEVAALTKAFRAAGRRRGFCALGSVKTNIGHTGSAAGVAGLLKTVAALSHRQIPPSLHFEQPNPQIDFAATPFYVNTALSEWKAGSHPRRAGVSSFGIGGTNAHLVLEEAPAATDPADSRPWQLLLLSAKTETALAAAAANLAAHLDGQGDTSFPDVAYTCQVGRKAFQQRLMLVCRDRTEASVALRGLTPGATLSGEHEGHARPVAFMFSGLGDQYVGMGVGLYRAEPTFRKYVDECARILRPLLGLDLREVLYPEEARPEAGAAAAAQPVEARGGLDLRRMLKRTAETPDPASDRLNQTRLAHPAIFTVEYALARLWMEWGLLPRAMIGHSIGEYVAACLAGVFSLEDALTLVARRAQMIQEMEGGAMLAVPLTEAEVMPLLGERLSLAAVNGPALCVVAGPSEEVAGLERALAGRSLVCRRLPAAHAFHSQMMIPVAAPFADFFKGIKLSPPEVPFVSNVTGTWVRAEEATDPAYWASHLCRTVRFADGVRELLRDERTMLLEVGPGQSLTTFATQSATVGGSRQVVALASMRHSYDRQPDVAFILKTLGQLWLAGVEVSWQGFYSHERRRRVPLPTYPFERQRYWVERRKATPTHNAPRLASADAAERLYVPAWRQSRLPRTPPAKELQGSDSCWVLFLDECGLGRELAGELERAGVNAVTVTPGGEFAQLDGRAYTLDPQQGEHYDALFRSLHEAGQVPRRLLHLWNFTPDVPARSGPEESEPYEEIGARSLLLLAQALGRQSFAGPLQLALVSNHMQDVTGVERLCPEKAASLGLCRFISSRYPGITCRSVDLDTSTAEGSPSPALTERLLAELAGAALEQVVAYRGSRRWVLTLEPARLEAQEGLPERLREGGVYLMTGELNGTALALSAYLAEDARAKVVLVSRPGSPVAERWMHALEAQDGDALTAVLARLRVASAAVVEADVTSEEQMRVAVGQVREEFGEIDGVMHFVGGGESLSADAAESDWRWRVGTHAPRVLERVLPAGGGAFCLLVSSAAPDGEDRNAAAAAAGGFMESFTHAHNERGLSNWTSVRLDAVVEPGEVEDIFRRVLAAGTESQIVVSDGDPTRRAEPDATPPPTRTAPPPDAAEESRAAYARPRLPSPYVAPSSLVERTIAGIWQELLGIEQIGVHDNFIQLGGDSMLAIRLAARLRKAFEVSLPPRVVFEAPTVADLALVVEEALIIELEEMTEGEAERVAALKE